MKIIMQDSDGAAKKQTVTGWVSSDGRFFGDDERLARYCGSTHKKCDKDSTHPIHRTSSYCEVCRDISAKDKFNKMNVVDWDESTPLNLYDTDTYFFCKESVNDYCEENNLKPSELRLVLCNMIDMQTVESDYWSDCFAEDVDLPNEVSEALDALNIAILEHGKAVSCWPSDRRVKLGDERLVATGE